MQGRLEIIDAPPSAPAWIALVARRAAQFPLVLEGQHALLVSIIESDQGLGLLPMILDFPTLKEAAAQANVLMEESLQDAARTAFVARITMDDGRDGLLVLGRFGPGRPSFLVNLPLDEHGTLAGTVVSRNQEALASLQPPGH